MLNGTRDRLDNRPSLGALVADIASDLSQLVRGEIDLAKAEIKESARRGAVGGALLAAAAALILMVLILFTWAAVYGLSETGLPIWACFLIVGGAYLIGAAILGLLGVHSLKKARGPEQAIAELQRTKEIVEALPPNTPPASAKSTTTPVK